MKDGPFVETHAKRQQGRGRVMRIPGLHVELNKVVVSMASSTIDAAHHRSPRSLGHRALKRRGPLFEIISSYNKFELRPAVAFQVLDDQPVAPDIDNGRRGEPIQASQLAAELRARRALTLQDADGRAPQNEVAPLPRGDEAFRPRRRWQFVKAPTPSTRCCRPGASFNLCGNITSGLISRRSYGSRSRQAWGARNFDFQAPAS